MCEDTVINTLKEQGITFKTRHQFTDGSAAHFKWRKAFADITLQDSPGQRNFFETSHGQSVSDGLGTVVKYCGHNAVISGKAILATAKDVFCCCEDHLTLEERHSKADDTYTKREFLFIEEKEVDHSRPEVDVKTLVGTRKVHCVRGTVSLYVIQTKNLSCYCKACEKETTNICSIINCIILFSGSGPFIC